ncbi:glycosyltransferase [Roseateles toxinivorans]|uniref:Rhamnosyltransferase subunit B n=1 Tax=Roseateles toxinivorans TaxID=270368 RepID=A0A4R6QTU6_9BURK|nr:glycosyltransferase [Roseateles toxinivorans]TDP74523.1 rhamnosyltransferase subunit B [Roseateles toxinivorans]
MAESFKTRDAMLHTIRINRGRRLPRNSHQGGFETVGSCTMELVSRVVICAVGTGGDVLPFIQIGSALAGRGLPVKMLGPGRYKSYADALGIDYESIGSEDIFSEVFDGHEVWNPRKGTAAAWRYYTAAMHSGYELIARRWSPAGTLLVSSTFALAARLAEERDGFANTTVHLSPSVIFSAMSPPKWPAASIPPEYPLWLKRGAMSLVERLALDPVIAPGVNKVRALLGLKPVAKVFSCWIHSPRRVVYAFPAWFAAAAADWPHQGVHGGFPLQLQRGLALPKTVNQFLAMRPDKPTVLVTAGTAVAHGAGWMKRCILGALAAGAKVIAVGSSAPSQNVDVDVLWIPFAPFETLFRRVSLVVHHGGIGTMAEALRSAVHQLAVPNAHDQFDNAHRLAREGFGEVGRANWSTAEFTTAIGRALADSRNEMRRLRCGRLMADQDRGGETVAALVLGLEAPAQPYVGATAMATSLAG